MASIQTIIETIFGYPIQVLIKDSKDLLREHKLPRNFWRIACGATGSVLGGVVPTLIAPDISDYVSRIVQAIFPIASVPSYITGNLLLVYLGLASGLYFGKVSAQIYYYARYKDSNSGHILYSFELANLSRLYQSPAHHKGVLEARITSIFKHLVVEIRRVKSPHQGSPIEPISLAWTKGQLKGVLDEFMLGNEDPYAFFYRLAHLKENFVQARIAERISEINKLLNPPVEELPEVLNNPGLHLRANSVLRHRRMSTFSEGDLQARHPKIQRYVSQARGEGGGYRTAGDLEQVKTLLLSKGLMVKDTTKAIPKPLQLAAPAVTSPEPISRRIGLRIEV